jgi:dTDP-4-amino-4,6-dideoxygalactose transaminase
VKIPFVNLRLQYESIWKETVAAIDDVFQQGQFIGGKTVRQFEEAFARELKVTHCIGTGNGTDALFIILKSLQIGHGDEVIVPAFSCLPTSEVISLTGATPVFCDVDPVYYTINPDEARKKISSQTKAIIAVHLFGQAAPLQTLSQLCKTHNLYLVEDCAQAHLTLSDKKPAGTFGIASAFSFYPTKNLGAFGDAGCIVTQQTDLAETLRRWTNHGALVKDDHRFEGTNSRLDTLQAAMLSVKLRHLQAWNDRRREIAHRYKAILRDIPSLTLPEERPGTFHTFHIFCLATPQRDQLKKYLAEAGIETLIHYPYTLPLTEVYARHHSTEEDFPVAARLPREVLSLPVYPELTDHEVEFIGHTVWQYFLQ